jgi:hypothetical protein
MERTKNGGNIMISWPLVVTRPVGPSVLNPEKGDEVLRSY